MHSCRCLYPLVINKFDQTIVTHMKMLSMVLSMTHDFCMSIVTIDHHLSVSMNWLNMIQSYYNLDLSFCLSVCLFTIYSVSSGPRVTIYFVIYVRIDHYTIRRLSVCMGESQDGNPIGKGASNHKETNDTFLKRIISILSHDTTVNAHFWIV